MKTPFGITELARDKRSRNAKFLTAVRFQRELPFPFPDGKGTDSKGNVWFTVSKGIMTISTSYAWNGASPKRLIFGVFFGTPDFYDTILPTLWHDVFFQFSHAIHRYVTMIQVNTMFHQDMKNNDFKLADLYHDAVSEFGDSFWAIPDKNTSYILT